MTVGSNVNATDALYSLRLPFNHKHQGSNVHVPDANQNDTVHHFLTDWDVTYLSHCLDSPVYVTGY
jgi:hypothetical protein